jgi:hypothetical protein
MVLCGIVIHARLKIINVNFLFPVVGEAEAEYEEETIEIFEAEEETLVE